MNKILIFILILFFITNNYAQNEMEKINTIIHNVKEQFAPDKRTSVFNIEVVQENEKLILKGETNLTEANTELAKLLSDQNINIKDEIEYLPSKSLGEKIFGVINLSVANLRSKPDHAAELVTQAILGTPIKVLKKGEDGYYLVQTPDNYIAWLDDDGFEFKTESELVEWNGTPKLIYIKEFGFSFVDADDKSQTVSDLVAGNLLKIIGEDSNFYLAEYPDGRKAYIKKEETKIFNDWYNALNPTGETVLKTAYRFMGIPYLWGGTSAKGMDCSGFTKTVYFLNGIILQRDASQQVNTGELVEVKNGWDNLQAGDLLFFGRKADENRKERITHVAIYIGDGDFIHAAGRVRINSLNPSKSYYSKYRDNSFIRAKRILSSVGKDGIEKILDNNFYKVK
jgi:gamma-D-glutamyl-L-lysine dipeptidyl-peptidase